MLQTSSQEVTPLTTKKFLKFITFISVLEFANANPDKIVISIHENVYDVTDFLDEHPGGKSNLKICYFSNS
jgi:cytochrome b involved in lipid metabolism